MYKWPSDRQMTVIWPSDAILACHKTSYDGLVMLTNLLQHIAPEDKFVSVQYIWAMDLMLHLCMIVLVCALLYNHLTVRPLIWRSYDRHMTDLTWPSYDNRHPYRGGRNNNYYVSIHVTFAILLTKPAKFYNYSHCTASRASYNAQPLCKDSYSLGLQYEPSYPYWWDHRAVRKAVATLWVDRIGCQTAKVLRR